MHFEVLSDRPCLIDAIGELEAGKAIKVSGDQLFLFKSIHGVSLAEAKFPPDITVTYVIPEEG